MTTGVNVTHSKTDHGSSSIEATAPSAGHEIAISGERGMNLTPADAGTDDYGTAVAANWGDWESQGDVYEQADLSDDPTWDRDASGEGGVIRISYDDASGTAASSASDGDLGGSTSTPTLPDIPNASINDADFLAILVVIGQNADARTATTWPSGFTEDIDDFLGSEEWWAGTVHIATKLVTGHDTGTDYSPGSVTMSGNSLWTGATVIVPTTAGGDATPAPATLAGSTTMGVTATGTGGIKLEGGSYIRDGNGPDISTNLASLDSGTIADGDVAILTFMKDQDDGSAHSQTAGATFTQIHFDESVAGRDRSTSLWYRVLDGTETTVTFEDAGDTIEEHSLLVSVWRGVDNTTPFDVTWNATNHYTENQNNYNGTPDPITTVTDGAMVVISQCITHDDITTAGAPSGYTIAIDGTGTTQDHAQQIHVYKLISSAGTETPGAMTHTVNAAVSEANFRTIALMPESSGTDATPAPATIAGSATIAVTATGESNATPTPATLLATVSLSVTASASTNATPTPSTLQGSTTLGVTATGESNATPAPAGLAAVTSISVTATGESNASPSAASLLGATSISVTASGGTNATPTPGTLLGATTIAVTSSGTSTATPTPATVVGSTTLSVAASGGTSETATPATITASTVISVTATGGTSATAAPATVDGSTIIGVTATGESNATPNAATLTGSTAMSATALTTATATPATVEAVTTIDGPVVIIDETTILVTVSGVTTIGVTATGEENATSTPSALAGITTIDVTASGTSTATPEPITILGSTAVGVTATGESNATPTPATILGSVDFDFTVIVASFDDTLSVTRTMDVGPQLTIDTETLILTIESSTELTVENLSVDLGLEVDVDLTVNRE